MQVTLNLRINGPKEMAKDSGPIEFCKLEDSPDPRIIGFEGLKHFKVGLFGSNGRPWFTFQGQTR